MDNGQIWFDSFNFAKPKEHCPHEGVEKDPEMLKASVEEVVKFLGESIPLDEFWEYVDRDVSFPPKDANRVGFNF
jgi:hypothetical protein